MKKEEKVMEKKTYEKKVVLDTQIIVGENNFILAKKRNSFKGQTSVECFVPVTFFEETDENGEVKLLHECDFNISSKILHRVQNFVSLIPSICTYKVSMDNIEFDCLSGFPDTMFPKNSTGGFLHFLTHTKYEKQEGKKPLIVNEVEDRLFIQEISDKKSFTLENPGKIDFKTKDLKVFPVFFNKGIAVAIATAELATLYITIQDVKKMFCGALVQSELNNLIHNIFPLFPIFNATINDKSATVCLKNIGEIKQSLQKITDKNSVFVKIEYAFENPNEVLVTLVGYSE